MANMVADRGQTIVCSCPRCGAPDTLIPIGERHDHTSRWLPWSIIPTLVCLCDACDEIVVLATAQGGVAA